MKAINKRGWKKVSFGDVCMNVNETSKNPIKEGIERYIGLEHIEPGNIHIKSWGNVIDGTTFTKKFKKGQVLFGKRRAYQKKAAVADFNGLCSGDILVFEANESIIDKNLFPFLVSSDGFFDFAVQTSAGSLSPRTKFQDLAKYEFLLPPRDQQVKLAELLRAAFEVTEKYEKLKSFLWLSKESIRKMFFKEYEGEVIKLKELVKVTTGGTPSTSIREYWDNGTIKWMSSGDVHKKIIYDVEGRITEKGLHDSSAKLIPKNSVVIALAGQGKTKGTVAITKTELCTNQSVASFLPNEKNILSEFLYHYLDSKYQDFREMTGDKNSRTGLNLGILKDISIPKIDISKQRIITNKLNLLDDIISKLEIHSYYTRNLQKVIINQIFSA